MLAWIYVHCSNAVWVEITKKIESKNTKKNLKFIKKYIHKKGNYDSII